ncbi:hypothetical protein GCM10022254_38820 [Actinomadura meridiana]|uniref:Uncharacterized protein n=1 Tax=Actinomadura meridiana TaxID=559626 RepID=A0ABP8C5Z0_9ACTN
MPPERPLLTQHPRRRDGQVHGERSGQIPVGEPTHTVSPEQTSHYFTPNTKKDRHPARSNLVGTNPSTRPHPRTTQKRLRRAASLSWPPTLGRNHNPPHGQCTHTTYAPCPNNTPPYEQAPTHNHVTNTPPRPQDPTTIARRAAQRDDAGDRSDAAEP